MYTLNIPLPILYGSIILVVITITTILTKSARRRWSNERIQRRKAEKEQQDLRIKQYLVARQKREKQDEIEKQLKKQEAEQHDLLIIKEEQKLIAELKSLFPGLWFLAYDDCQENEKYGNIRHNWIKKWLKKKEKVTLPRLTLEAIRKFATMIDVSGGGVYYKITLKILAPYLEKPKVYHTTTCQHGYIKTTCTKCKKCSHGFPKSLCTECKDNQMIAKSVPKPGHCPHGMPSSLCTPNGLCIDCREFVETIKKNVCEHGHVRPTCECFRKN